MTHELLNVDQGHYYDAFFMLGWRRKEIPRTMSLCYSIPLITVTPSY